MLVEDSLSRAGIRRSFARIGRIAYLIEADAPIYALIGLYAAVVLAFSIRLEQIGNVQLLSYLRPFLILAASVLIGHLLVASLIPGIRADPRSPWRPMLSIMKGALKPHIVSGFLLFAAIAIFLGAFTTLKNLLPLLNDFTFDRQLADLDRLLHLGHDPWTLLKPSPALLQYVEFLYGIVWGSSTPVFAMFMAMFCTDRELRMRFFLVYIVTWIFLGNVLACAFLSGGPAFYHHFAEEAERFAGLRALLEAGEGSPLSAYAFQSYLWNLHINGRAGLASGISAFPSLHVAIAALCAMTTWRLNRALGMVAWIFALSILIGSVYLGWHYAIDGYVSIIAVAVLWWSAGRAMNRRFPDRGAPRR